MVQLVEKLHYSRNVEGSISDVVIGIFHWFNSSLRSMVLGSTQMLTKTGTTGISWD